MSRLLVWSAGMLGVLVSDADAYRELTPAAPDPDATLGGVLLSPADRWDSGWFLSIAQGGYDSQVRKTAFFPLYPLLIRLVAEPFDLVLDQAFEWAGVLVSLVALLVALALLHRLTELELGRAAADNAVLLLAFFPMSFYLSAIYSESLFLALSLGSVYLARRGRWWPAAALGGLAAATRSQGVLLLIPLAIMLLSDPGGSWRRPRKPRLAESASLLLVPAGLVAYLSYIRATTNYGFLAPVKSQSEWMREFRGPIVGVWGGIKSGATATRDLLNGSPVSGALSDVRSGLLNFAALVLGALGVGGALRRLPVAYGAYALACLIFIVSSPTSHLELKSLPRLAIVIFPAFMWAGWALSKCRYRTAIIAVSAVALACFSAAFASGYWIA